MMQTSGHSTHDPLAEAPFPTIAILGLGLLGGSLGLALKRTTPAVRILGCARRQQAIDEAIALGAIDSGSIDPGDVLPEADLTVICTPVATIIAMLQSYREYWRPGAVITDVGSVKGEIMRAAAGLLSDLKLEFIGSHPMAGSDRSGLSHARVDLYHCATVFITAGSGAPAATVAAVEWFWRTCGARTVQIDANAHDALVARTSHLPHILAAAAVQVGLTSPHAVLGTAGAFRDVTRIAGSSPQMWRQIFELNRDELLQALDEYAGQLVEIRARLAADDWDVVEEYLEDACDKRRQWESQWYQSREEAP